MAVPETDSESEDEFCSEQSEDEPEIPKHPQHDEVAYSEPETDMQPQATFKRQRTVL